VSRQRAVVALIVSGERDLIARLECGAVSPSLVRELSMAIQGRGVSRKRTVQTASYHQICEPTGPFPKRRSLVIVLKLRIGILSIAEPPLSADKI
jgi:hypothetical protein